MRMTTEPRHWIWSFVM